MPKCLLQFELQDVFVTLQCLQCICLQQQGVQASFCLGIRLIANHMLCDCHSMCLTAMQVLQLAEQLKGKYQLMGAATSPAALAGLAWLVVRLAHGFGS